MVHCCSAFLLVPLFWREAASFLHPLEHIDWRKSVINHLNLASEASLLSKYENDGTVVQMEHKVRDVTVTLIGTAHLSKASNEQVKSIIESVRPDAVMVELDTTRLDRVGFNDLDLGIPFSTADGIVYPLDEDDLSASKQKQWWSPFQVLLLNIISKVGRMLLTDMYNELEKEMDLKGGGEFVAAINAAKKIPECKKVVLGDRDSVTTLRRAAELVLRSGDPMGILYRLLKVNEEEMSALEKEVMNDVSDKDTEDDITVMLIEKLKSSTEMRTRYFSRLQEEVPELERAFVEERDFIMAEALRREVIEGSRNICAVVGLAHVPGIAQNLRRLFFDIKE